VDRTLILFFDVEILCLLHLREREKEEKKKRGREKKMFPNKALLLAKSVCRRSRAQLFATRRVRRGGRFSFDWTHKLCIVST